MAFSFAASGRVDTGESGTSPTRAPQAPESKQDVDSRSQILCSV